MTTCAETMPGPASPAGPREDATPAPGGWTPVNLAWNPDFWQRMTPQILVRLNPHWEILDPETGDAPDTLRLEDHLQEKVFTSHILVETGGGQWRAEIPALGLTLRARASEGGQNTEIAFESTDASLANLDGMVSDDPQENAVFYWFGSIREYLRIYSANGLKERFWRVFMNKCWLTMTPAQRRMCLFMFKFSLLEIAVIICIAVGYWVYTQ